MKKDRVSGRVLNRMMRIGAPFPTDEGMCYGAVCQKTLPKGVLRLKRIVLEYECEKKCGTTGRLTFE